MARLSSPFACVRGQFASSNGAASWAVVAAGTIPQQAELSCYSNAWVEAAAWTLVIVRGRSHRSRVCSGT